MLSGDEGSRGDYRCRTVMEARGMLGPEKMAIGAIEGV